MRQPGSHGQERRKRAADPAASPPPEVPPDVEALETSRLPRETSSRRGQYLVLYLLAAVFVGISLWCFVILGRTESLRSDLARHMDWLEQAGTLREAVFSPAEGARAGAGPSSFTRRDAERLVAATRRLVAGHGSPELGFAAERLVRRLHELSAEMELATDGPDVMRQADVAEAAYAALSVLPDLEPRVQDHVVDLYSGLDRLWTSMRTLVLLCLALCGSNLGLLYLVHRRREQLATAHAKAVALASHDALTGAWNRRAILRILRLELSRAERSGRPLGVILLDLDDFRKLNVLLGSREADHILQEISRRLETFVRPYDTLGRLGGDSFLVILPSCDRAATAGVADRLTQAIETDDVEHAHGSVPIRVTLVHETLVHDVDPEDTDSEDAEAVDADLLVHGLQLRIEQARNP